MSADLMRFGPWQNTQANFVCVQCDGGVARHEGMESGQETVLCVPFFLMDAAF